MVTINIQKRHLFIILALIIFLTGIILVVSNPDKPNPGHTVDEIEGAQKRITGICPDGSSIKLIKDDGTVECETDNIGLKTCSLECRSSVDYGGEPRCPEGYKKTSLSSGGYHPYFICCKVACS